MSDDITRQRFWSWNNAKADPAERHPRVPRSRSSSRVSRPTAAPTHVLMVKPHDCREWKVVADRSSGGSIRDVSGSEAYCQAELATRSRHFPDDQFRVLPWPEARRELRRKTWSVNDEDHIPDGERVMLMKAPEILHPSIGKVTEAFGIDSDHVRVRYGVVTSRHRRTGNYMIALEGTRWSISVGRADIVYPVPENVVALETLQVRRRRIGS